MSKFFINKSNFIEKFCKDKYGLCIIIFIFGVIMLLYYTSLVNNHTKLIESYTASEMQQISQKIEQSTKGKDKKSMDLSGLLTMDLTDLIKKLFGSKCLPGCMSPDNTNRNEQKCKKNISENGVILECPWRCNIPEFNKQMNANLMFKQDILSNNLKMCSVDNENIDCGGCVPLRGFE